MGGGKSAEVLLDIIHRAMWSNRNRIYWINEVNFLTVNFA